ncbi:Ger(x)C family spore germination protein [Priestia megaterium]|uniref:Ger(x)C family spore germination protein n=1 Tax=Priestia megaterium TaxID=1404 RepID=UPI0005C6D115|nr:Ger(x)C family spore germination protein [Priestia megaterium]
MNLFLSRNTIKTATIVLFFSTSFLLTGCWDRREINDTATVLTAAIDKEKGKNIRLTTQILIPRSVSNGQQGTGGAGSSSQVLIRSAIGENMADAMTKIQTKIPRRIFWGQCKVYIIGEKMAKKGNVREQVDFLLRHPEPRERAYMFVSEGDGANVLQLSPPLEPYQGEVLRKLAEMQVGVKTTVKDFEQMSISDSETVLLPLINKLPPSPGRNPQETIAYIIGTAIFRKDKMVNQIDTKVTRGLLWLRNEIEVTAVTITPKKGQSISLDPIREQTILLPSIENGKWKMTVKIRSEGTIVQNGSDLDIMDPIVKKKVEKELENDIKARINLCLKQVQKKMKIDAFGFGDAFHRKYPKEWNKVKDHWDKVLPEMDVKIDIKTRVRRSGLSTTPTGLGTR